MKQEILNTISDLCSDFLYYDRKEDEDLTMEQLNDAVNNGEITVDEMVAEFRKHLENTFKESVVNDKTETNTDSVDREMIKLGDVIYIEVENHLCAFVYLRRFGTNEVYPVLLNTRYLQNGYESFKMINKLDDRFPSLDLSDREMKS
jgi:hypothetical protein